MNFHKPLAGTTILVTRPRQQSEELASQLRRRGARVIIAPAIRIRPPASWRPLHRSIRNLSTYDAVLFTSANAVEIFFRRALVALNRRPRRPRHVYAIGPRTARALARHGWRGIGVPERYEGEALARHLAKRHRSLRGWNILLPRARVARDVLPKSLARFGARVDLVEAYHTAADPVGRRRIRKAVAAGRADIVTFTSSSTVEQFMTAATPVLARKFFKTAIAASIGPVTSSALRRHGIRRLIQARAYTTEGLVRAILDKA